MIVKATPALYITKNPTVKASTRAAITAIQPPQRFVERADPILITISFKNIEFCIRAIYYMA